MEQRLNEFLNAFYDTISFDSADKFDSLRFESMFFQNATLVERANDALRSETILEYINRFLYEMRHFPELYQHGLKERQTACETVIGEEFILVKSEYEKTWHDGTQTVVSTGCNYIMLCEADGWFKILSIAWAA